MPKRKSEKEKKLTGNPGKRELKQDAPDFDLPMDLKAPPNLRPDAVDYWEEAAAQLQKKNLLQTPDIPLLVTYCNALALSNLAYKQMGNELELVNPDNGLKYSNHLFKMGQTADRLAVMIGSKFGFNPLSRASLKIAPKDEDSELEKLKNRGVD
jgi:P27 family predicted phage terminase small subunit